jgi:hypothetical protein
MSASLLDLVKHNFETLAILSEGASARKPPTDITDWKCTILFYMACIYLRALASNRKKVIERHMDARDWLNAEPDLIYIAKSYRKLEERSRDARYEGRRFKPAEMQEAYRWFCEVRDKLVDLLKKDGLASVESLDPKQYLF